MELCLYLHHPQVQSGWEVVVRLLDTCSFQAVVSVIYPHHIGTPYRHWNNKMKEDYQLLVMSRHEYLGKETYVLGELVHYGQIENSVYIQQFS